MSEPFIGTIMAFGFNFAPRGWAQCMGQLLSISQNTALFSLLGTTYGGDGVTTFGLPDLRGRVPVGQGQGPGLSNYTLGEETGSENITLISAQMPSHTHVLNDLVATMKVKNVPGTQQNAVGNVMANEAAGVTALYSTPGTPYVNMSADAIALSSASGIPIAPTGGNQPFPILQPLLVVNYCIALEGVFPSRN